MAARSVLVVAACLALASVAHAQSSPPDADTPSASTDAEVATDTVSDTDTGSDTDTVSDTDSGTDTVDADLRLTAPDDRPARLEVALRHAAYAFDAPSFLAAQRAALVAVFEAYCGFGNVLQNERTTVELVVGIGCFVGAATLTYVAFRNFVRPSAPAAALHGTSASTTRAARASRSKSSRAPSSRSNARRAATAAVDSSEVSSAC